MLKMFGTFGPWILTFMGALVSIFPPQEKWKRAAWIILFGLVGIPVAVLAGRDSDKSSNLQQDTNKTQHETNSTVSSIDRRLPNAWPLISDPDAKRLYDTLRKLEPETVTIACETPLCSAFADQLQGIFSQAAWDPRKLHGGGIGISGVTGIVIDSCNGTAKTLATAIIASTNLKPVPHEDNGCRNNDHIVIGAVPF